MIAQKGCAKMFDGMHLCRVHYRLGVRTGHADIECCDDRIPGMVFPRYIKAGKKRQMVNCETGNFFHGQSFLFPMILKFFIFDATCILAKLYHISKIFSMLQHIIFSIFRKDSYCEGVNSSKGQSQTISTHSN